MTRARPRRLLAVPIACLWLAAHAASLARYPAMHADEAWLASETRSILAARSAAAGADFYHITPRSPHAIRLLFNGLQAPFVAAGWSLVSVRLLSLACGLSTVALAAVLASGLFRGSAARLLMVGGLAADPQLFAASHLARPEIVLVLVLLGAALVRARRPLAGLWTEVLVGSLLGLAVGLHANSLLVALALGAAYAVDVLAGPDRRLAARRLAVLVGVVALWAGFWVGWSRLLSPDFPRAYQEFGQRYGVAESLPVKALRLPGFYVRLFARVTGTYHVPDLRLTLTLFAAAAATGLVLLVPGKRAPAGGSRARIGEPLAMLAAVNLGLVLIGKYSQPTAALLVPAGYWLAAAVLDTLSGSAAGGRGKLAIFGAAVLVAGLGFSTARSAAPWMAVSYGRYLQRIRAHVPADAPVMAGPNTAFAFAPGALHAFNDLDALGSAGLSFGEYVERHGIRFILYPTELDRIHAERPLWNDLYGNVTPYYRDLQLFLADRCELVAVFDEPVFAVRIAAYQPDPSARLAIYRVLPEGP